MNSYMFPHSTPSTDACFNVFPMVTYASPIQCMKFSAQSNHDLEDRSRLVFLSSLGRSCGIVAIRPLE